MQGQVLSDDRQVQVRQAVLGGLLAVDREVGFRPEHVGQALGQGRGFQVDTSARRAPLLGPGAVCLQRRGRARASQDVERRAAGGAIGLGLQVERTVGRQAQGAGDRAAIGLGRIGDQVQALGASQVEIEFQVVAGVQARGDTDRALLPAQARHLVVARNVEVAVLSAEGGARDQPELEGVQVHRHRRSAGLGAFRLHGRAPQDHDVAGVDALGVEAAAEQLGRTPRHAQVVGLQPDPLLVGDGQAANAEVLPDVARQAFDLQLADAAQLQARGAGLQEHPALRRDRRQAQTAGHDDQQARQDRRGDQQGAAPADLLGGLHGGLARRFRGMDDGLRQVRLVVLPAQKLCPMLR